MSLQSALAYRGLIPEHVPVTTSVTLGRPGRWETPLGTYEYRRIQRRLFTGYEKEGVMPGQEAYVATAAKAILDLVYLVPGGDAPEYLGQLRLTNLDRVDFGALHAGALVHRPKLRRAVRRVREMALAEDARR